MSSFWLWWRHNHSFTVTMATILRVHDEFRSISAVNCPSGCTLRKWCKNKNLKIYCWNGHLILVKANFTCCVTRIYSAIYQTAGRTIPALTGIIPQTSRKTADQLWRHNVFTITCKKVTVFTLEGIRVVVCPGVFAIVVYGSIGPHLLIVRSHVPLTSNHWQPSVSRVENSPLRFLTYLCV